MHDDRRAFQCSIGKHKRAAYWPFGAWGKAYAFACVRHHVDYENTPVWPHTACNLLTETTGLVQHGRHVDDERRSRPVQWADLCLRLITLLSGLSFAVPRPLLPRLHLLLSNSPGILVVHNPISRVTPTCRMCYPKLCSVCRDMHRGNLQMQM